MRVPDVLTLSVAYLAEEIALDSGGSNFDLIGSGFFIAVPSTVHQGVFHAFVTAKHLVDEHKGRQLDLVVNGYSGKPVVIPIPLDWPWFSHPTDKSADVAITPFSMQPEVKAVSLRVKDFVAASEVGFGNKLGEGDEVFFPGLFTWAPGESRMTPIVRHGHLAMIPDGPIQVDNSFADVYLIEAHSIGGMSGSPVYVRETVSLSAGMTGTGNMKLLGLMHGHWDIKESEMNKPSFVHDRQRGVNMGIAVVVPASKILETVNHPELVAMRERTDAEINQGGAPGPDV